MELTAYMEYLEETNIARTAFAPIRNAPEKTRGSFMTSTMSTMQLFGSRKLNKAIGRSDFQYKDFATDKIALFIVNPDEKSTYDKIASIQYDQSYQEFVEIANKNGGRVPRRIHNIFDEAGNMAFLYLQEIMKHVRIYPNVSEMKQYGYTVKLDLIQIMLILLVEIYNIHSKRED